MKRKTSKEILAESFREVAERKNIDKITVKDITENCGYSPATFYRQFHDKYDLIAWDYTRELKNFLSRMDGSKAEWQNVLLCVANFFQERKVYLANLFLHTSGLESFIAYMQEVHFRSLKDIVEKASFSSSIDTLTEMYIRLYVLGSAQFTCEWILGKFEATAQELATVFEQTLPSPLQKYLS
ncbi:MAG: TetR family transcriptional regulator [Clostridia bacterium]|nr:TetR family transcriptional regulator [Clostridia bacterium]